MSADAAADYGIETALIAESSGAAGAIDGVETLDHVACVAARNDYLPTDKWVGDMTYAEIMAGTSTETLIRRLLKPPGHFGPFEHPELTIAIKGISRVTMAQLTRHRVGITFDVQSSRYTMPPIDLIRAMDDGRAPLDAIDAYVVVPKLAVEREQQELFRKRALQSFVDYADMYEGATRNGTPEARAKEDARFLLPKALRVNVVVSANLRTWMHIADMRSAGDAQWEIRALTDDLLDLIGERAPVTMGAYRDLLHERKHRLAP